LQRYTGLQHLSIGVPATAQVLARSLARYTMNGGTHEHARNMMAYLVDTLAIRVNCHPTATFIDMIQSVRRALLGGPKSNVPNQETKPTPTVESSVPPLQVLFHGPELIPPSIGSPVGKDLGAAAVPTAATELALALSEKEGRWTATVHYAST